ncbi:MAG: glutamine--fructose-6-phosphate transaminase (isomerizing) [Bdellovibrionales bacterium]|nr:glutamine--fructose-6-phosphate transaminase (isomerizing) [Bdellovibrionales bacterium]
MCGIIGYYGSRDPKQVIYDGLKKLEYRGYDSAGIAILDNGKLKRVRSAGKLIHLKEKLDNEKFTGNIGIGHTRWATHGVPNESNAHPHAVGKISLVHNGIIENYQEIKEYLLKEGAKITSDTDSELVAHLISREIEKGSTLKEALSTVIPKLEGAYSIAALSENEPDTLVAVKNGPPLVLGLGKDECFVASDAQAIITYTNKVIFIDDHEIVVAKKDKYQIYDMKGSAISKKITELDMSPDAIEKQGYPHFMKKEIYEQPRVVAAAMSPHIDVANLKISLQVVSSDSNGEALKQDELYSQLKHFERVFIVACGTSFYAGLTGEYILEAMAGIPVEVEFASEFRYRKPVIPKNSLVIVISQSGETADTLASLRMAKEKGAKTLSICNAKNSSIDREAFFKMYMKADAEIGVASTKALTATLALLNLLGVYLGRVNETLTRDEEKSYLRSLQALPSEIEKVLAYDSFFDEAALTLKDYKGFLYMGRGVNYPMAMEGALKLKELAYMHAEGYAAGEMKHGPIALIDDRMAVVVVAPTDDVYEKTVSNLEEVRARGGQIIAIGTGHNERLKSLAKHYLSLPKTSWNLNPVLSVIPLQLMAYHVADRLGFDVDQPRNLAKSVTVE